MANKFNTDLKGRYVVLSQNVETGTGPGVMSRLVKVESGNGCNPNGMGSKVFVRFVANPARKGPDNDFVMVDAHPTSKDIERLATQSEIEVAQLEG